MRQARRHGSLAVGLLALLLAAAGCTALHKDGSREDEAVVWREKVVPGPAVTLRMQWTEGRYLIYEGSLKRTQKSANSYDEDDQFYLNMFCAEQKDGRNLLALWRTYTDRKRVEKLANGKTIDRILENTNDLLDLGPNSSLVGTTRCYAYDAQNQLAFRTSPVVTLTDGRQLYGTLVSQDEQKIVLLVDTEKLELPREKIASLVEMPTPHFCTGEALHYLFPIFSEHAVAPGQTWRFKVPLLMPIGQGPASRVLPTQFNAVLTGRLREVRETREGQVATVDYHVSGLFDSSLSEFRERLPGVFADNHFVHRLSGDGTVWVNVAKGRILARNEDFKVRLFASSVVPRDNQPAQVDENRADITSRFELKLLPPGTRLRSGAMVPPYE